MKYIATFRSTTSEHNKGMVLERNSLEEARRDFIKYYGKSIDTVYAETNFNREMQFIPFGSTVIYKEIDHETLEEIRELIYPV